MPLWFHFKIHMPDEIIYELRPLSRGDESPPPFFILHILKCAEFVPVKKNILAVIQTGLPCQKNQPVSYVSSQLPEWKKFGKDLHLISGCWPDISQIVKSQYSSLHSAYITPVPSKGNVAFWAISNFHTALISSLDLLLCLLTILFRND